MHGGVRGEIDARQRILTRQYASQRLVGAEAGRGEGGARGARQRPVRQEGRKRWSDPTGLDPEQRFRRAGRRNRGQYQARAGGVLPGLEGRLGRFGEARNSGRRRRRRPGCGRVTRQAEQARRHWGRFRPPLQDCREGTTYVPASLHAVIDPEQGEQFGQPRHPQGAVAGQRCSIQQGQRSRVGGGDERRQVKAAILRESRQVQDESRRLRVPLPDRLGGHGLSATQQHVQPVRQVGRGGGPLGAGNDRCDPGFGGIRQRDRAAARHQHGQRGCCGILPPGRQAHCPGGCIRVRCRGGHPHPNAVPCAM